MTLVISVISYQLSSTRLENRGAGRENFFFFPRIIDGLYPVSFLVKKMYLAFLILMTILSIFSKEIPEYFCYKLYIQ